MMLKAKKIKGHKINEGDEEFSDDNDKKIEEFIYKESKPLRYGRRGSGSGRKGVGARLYARKRKIFFEECDDKEEANVDDAAREDEKVLIEADLAKIWADSASFVDIIRLQSRDGFWDLPSSFESQKLGEKSIDVGIDLEDSPIVKKRVMSTVFTLGYLAKFYDGDSNKLKFAKEKSLKWLMRINSTANWEEIIANNISLISK